MFFSLTNSPTTFQSYMNDRFQPQINQGWLFIYMDDPLIFSKDLATHRQCTKEVLDILRQEKLFVKPEKCVFNAKEVEYLGMIICSREVGMEHAKVEGIKQWPTPANVKDTCSFLGFCNFYRAFVAHYSDIV